MNCLKHNVLFLFLIIGFHLNLKSEVTTEIKKLLDSATAMVIVEKNQFKSCGTAFCIDESGYYVTSTKVIQSKLLGESVTLKLSDHSNKKMTSLAAKIVLIDDDAGMAVLLTKSAYKHVKLKLGNSDNLTETTQLISAVRSRYVNKSLFIFSLQKLTVTSLVKNDKGKLEAIQVSANVYDNGIGNPLVNHLGEVVAMTAFKKPKLKNMVSPINKLKKLLKKPIVEINLPTIKHSEKFLPVDFSVSVAMSEYILPDKLSVSLELKNQYGDISNYVLSHIGKGLFAKKVRIFNDDNQKIKQISGEVTCLNGKISGLVENAEFKLNDNFYQLENIKKIESVTKKNNVRVYRITFRTNKILEGEIKNLKKIKVTLGKDLFQTINLNDILKLDFDSIKPSDYFYHYNVRVNEGGKEIYQSNGEVSIVREHLIDSVELGVFGEFKPLTSGAKVIRLPGLINQVAVGGGGRFLVFHIKNLRKLAIFDSSKLEIVTYIPLISSDVVFGAGGSQLMIVYNDKRLIQKFSFNSLQVELTKPLPVFGIVKLISMGNSNGETFFLRWVGHGSNSSSGHIGLFQTKDLSKSDLTLFKTSRYGSARDRLHVRASADGKTFGLWSSMGSPGGMASLIRSGTKYEVFSKHVSPGFVIPSYDGSRILTGKLGIFSEKLEKIRPTEKKPNGFVRSSFSPLIPSYHPDFYFSISNKKNSKTKLSLKLYSTDTDKLLADLSGFSEMKSQSQNSSKQHDFTIEKRYHLIPQYDLLITIPPTNEKICIRKFDFVKIFKQLNLNYFFIISKPYSKIKAGKLFNYQIKVKTNKTGLEFKLESGPPGMTVSKNGLVNWKAVFDPEISPMVIIISALDSTGETRFHTFTLNVEK